MLTAQTRACTMNLKINPIYKFVEAYVRKEFGFQGSRKVPIKNFVKTYQTKITVMIGFTTQEEKRIHHHTDTCGCSLWFKESIHVIYPLISLGMNRSDIQQETIRLGHPLVIPSACDICHYQTLHQIEFFRRFDNSVLLKMEVLENNKLDKYAHKEKNYGIFGKDKITEVVAKAKDKFADNSDQEIILMVLSHSHNICNSY